MPSEFILSFAILAAVTIVVLLVGMLNKMVRKKRRHTHSCHGVLKEIRKDELLLVRPSHGRLIIPSYIATVETLRSQNIFEFRISKQWLGKVHEGDVGTFTYRHGSLLNFTPDHEKKKERRQMVDRTPIDAE